eukprot:TRINITY_DN6820_c0_g1_i16.p2 TRINITY_DN6820_c0_g1~~TRINITY_DN6820_c0_g1_i16.p2  ORF type:complete len:111 (+),score=5.04 TRINITY_DN6820_c0_g1_i16:256-588(+)
MDHSCRIRWIKRVVRTGCLCYRDICLCVKILWRRRDERILLLSYFVMDHSCRTRWIKRVVCTRCLLGCDICIGVRVKILWRGRDVRILLLSNYRILLLSYLVMDHSCRIR